MSSFTQPLTVTKIGPCWIVERPFRYYIDEEGSENYVDVPDGFLTDFASVPRIFWSILPPDGKYTQAAVLHDWLYKNKLFSRKQCDIIFAEAMLVLGVPLWKRAVMYRALRMFGGFAWSRKS